MMRQLREIIMPKRLLSLKRDASHYRTSLFTRAVLRARAIAMYASRSGQDVATKDKFA